MLILTLNFNVKTRRVVSFHWPQPAFKNLSNGIDSWRAVPALFTQITTTNLTTVKLYGFFHSGTRERPIADALIALSSFTLLHLCLTGFTDSLWSHLEPVLEPVSRSWPVLLVILIPLCSSLPLFRLLSVHFSVATVALCKSTWKCLNKGLSFFVYNRIKVSGLTRAKLAQE